MDQGLPTTINPLRAAVREFNLAKAAYEDMSKVQNGPFADFEHAWREFLHRLERVYGKTHAACQGRLGWVRAKKYYSKLRKEDELLVYVRQARNADEHTIQDVATDWQPNVQQEWVGSDLKVTWNPWDRPLLPVKVRGVIYNPPRTHLGHSLEPLLGKNVEEPLIVADLALQFYAGFLNDICFHFFPKELYGAP